MKRNTYHLTPTAESHFWQALADTKRMWGQRQAEKYRLQLLEGFQAIADNHRGFRFVHREALAEGTDFELHLAAQRYVAFQPFEKDSVIIAAMFHERMDIPGRLRELQQMSAQEIALLKQQIARLQ